MDDFDVFWERYPLRIGKLAAKKAYWQARKQATNDEILAGVYRYTEAKPYWASYAYPSTWLNAGRWMDELSPAPPRRTFAEHPCPHQPHCNSPYHCLLLQQLAEVKQRMRVISDLAPDVQRGDQP